MYEGNQIAAAQGTLGCYKDKDPMSQMTCGENLERKIAEQKERLAMLEAAMGEMKKTGLYDVNPGYGVYFMKDGKEHRVNLTRLFAVYLIAKMVIIAI